MASAMGTHAEETQLGFYRSKLSDAQRRRAEALILVSYMFPALTTGATKIELAQWVTTGKVVVR